MQESLLMAEGVESSTPFVAQTATYTNQAIAGQFVNGIFTGIVEVFPYESNQVRCQTNFTQGYDAGIRMYERTSFDFGSATF